jgi:adenine/guanine phosphoribosyltransferase-like PRPP-binding protein
MDAVGKAWGPLVGYAGQYETDDGKLLNYVGFVYYNVGKGDQWPHIAGHWARSHMQSLASFDPDLIVAAPMGGISYMSVLKQRLGCRGIFVEKKVIESAKDGKREKSKLVLGRYDVSPGDRIILIEDAVNNFSTTKQMVELVEAAGGTVRAIACVINRSDKTTYWDAPHDPLPVISLQHKPTPQYKQDDPAVAKYIAAGNIIMKPKDRWDELVAAEAAYA